MRVKRESQRARKEKKNVKCLCLRHTEKKGKGAKERSSAHHTFKKTTDTGRKIQKIKNRAPRPSIRGSAQRSHMWTLNTTSSLASCPAPACRSALMKGQQALSIKWFALVEIINQDTYWKSLCWFLVHLISNSIGIFQELTRPIKHRLQS